MVAALPPNPLTVVLVKPHVAVLLSRGLVPPAVLGHEPVVPKIAKHVLARGLTPPVGAVVVLAAVEKGATFIVASAPVP